MKERLKTLLESPAVREGVRISAWVTAISTAGVLTLWALARPGAISLPPTTALRAPAAPLVTTAGRFTRGTFLTTVLQQPPQQAQAIAQALTPLLDPRTLNEGDRYELVRSTAGDFARLAVIRKLERFIVEASPAGLVAKKEALPLTRRDKTAAGTLEGSLWLSLRAAGIEPAVVLAFSDIFAWNLDFLTETRAGDRYALAWTEERTPDDRIVDVTVTGAIYQGRATGRHTATLFGGEHYDEEGHSLRKAFLHAPLNFRRISSGFTNRRYHPILRTWRAHHGTDYAAPTGTPVVSIGDGTVIFRGWNGGLGNLIQVRHNSTYTTFYGHLSRFEKGLAVGQRVKQGQVIGRVGTTGLSTGPHLHFQVMKNGALVNFLRLKFPPVNSVPAGRRAAFEEKRDRTLPPLEKSIAPPL